MYAISRSMRDFRVEGGKLFCQVVEQLGTFRRNENVIVAWDFRHQVLIPRSFSDRTVLQISGISALPFSLRCQHRELRALVEFINQYLYDFMVDGDTQ